MSRQGTPQQQRQSRHTEAVETDKEHGGGAVALRSLPKTDDDSALVVRRLKEAYGFDMPDAAARYIADIHSRGQKQVQAGRSNNKHWQPESDGTSKRKILGRDVTAVSGQVVKHAVRGSRPDGSFDGDFYSGGGLGTITDVCGDHALVRWNNGNERFYYVGKTPWRKDATGVDTDNARAIRYLVLHEA